jgi:hypothetical protein
MLDAHQHGAWRNPEWQSRWDELTATTHRLRATMIAAGQSTDEYDRNVREDVRRFLKAKGLTDAEITERLSRSTDPLDVVKPYLGADKDSQLLEKGARQYLSNAASTDDMADLAASPVKAAPPSPSPALLSFDAITAKLRTPVTSSPDGADGGGHGLPANMRTGTGPSVHTPS